MVRKNRSTRLRFTIHDLRAFENYSLISGAARDALAVEVFEERDGVLAGDASQVFEGGDVNQALGLVAGGVLAQGGDQMVERRAVEEEVRADADERAVV